MLYSFGRTIVKPTKLADGTTVSCLLSTEARVLDHHVDGYFSHGITLSDGATVIDVGANIGVFGVRTLQRRAGIKVLACEPVPTIFACLEDNARRHGEGQFIPIECGISSTPGTAQFTYYPNSPALSTSRPEQWTPEELEEAVEGSLKNPPADLWFIKYLPRFVSKWFAIRMRQRAKTFECTLKTISNLIDEYQLSRIDLLKIDCEGAEYDCLVGIDENDWNKVQQVVVEVHDIDGGLHKVRTRLEQMGLRDQVIEQEAALEGTKLFNIFAKRPSEQL